MKKVAKLLMQNEHGDYLILKRNNHPKFGYEFDLPGGTAELNEDELATVAREVQEEIEITADISLIKLLYSGDDYSDHGTYYALYETKIGNTPMVTLSSEHQTYKWVDINEFLKIIKNSKDRYMCMVYDVVEKIYIK